MKLYQLRALIVVAESGSMHEASRVLHISQPAVSKALSDLEADLGAPLLTRSAKGAQLTAFGHSLIRHARAIEHELRHAREDIETLLGAVRGTLTIGVTPVTSVGPFADVLRRFTETHPDVTINVLELRPMQIRESLSDGSIDFAVMSRIGEPDDSRFYWEPLYTTSNHIAVRSDNPLSSVNSLADLVAFRWLSLDRPDDAAGLIGTLFDTQGVEPPTKVLRCMSTGLYVELATTTNLISVWGAPAFQLPYLEGRLRKIALREPIPDLVVGVACRDIELVTKLSATFIDMIRSACKSLSAPYRRGDGRAKRRTTK